MSTNIDHLIRESATALLLRSAPTGPEVLLLQKNNKINYGGSWVFPGGVTESEDHLGLDSLHGESHRTEVSQRTVIRETQEETGLTIEPEQLTPFSNWLTPNFRIKRYNTLFFVGELTAEQADQAIEIDAEEIVDFRWITPSAALTEQAQGSLQLNGPSFVTLKILEKCKNTQAAIATLTRNGIHYYEPRGLKTHTGVATVYQGDCAYELDELNVDSLAQATGVQHRLYMHKDLPWQFFDTR